MTTTNYTVKIENEMFGKLLSETFVDAIQFKLFLKMIQGCLELRGCNPIQVILEDDSGLS